MTKRSTTFKYITATLMALGSSSIVNGGFTAIPDAAPPTADDRWRYADVADLFAAAPLVVRAKIVSATILKGPPTPNRAVRLYVEGDVTTLIRGNQAVPPRLAWLVDVLHDSRGKIPKLKKADVLIAARAVAGRPGEIQLAARDAQVIWSAALDARVRSVIADVGAADAPPVVTGVTSVFHSAGTVPGEGETQIFLSTASRAPVSLTVLSRPGQSKRWAVAFGEIVDESAAPPAPDSLAWYRLACFLPNTLPSAAAADLLPDNAVAAANDYAFVIGALGQCVRARR